MHYYAASHYHVVAYVNAALVTDRVAWSVLSRLTIVSHTKTAEPIKLPFGIWTQVGL